MKKILVTGGAGFIGSHLCRELLNNGDEVYCLDNLFTGTEENIHELLPDSRFHFINHDIIEPFYPDSIDQIYNLACPASPVHYKYDSIKTAKVCFLGALNTLGMAKSLGVRILQASTSEVYGDPELHPQIESYWGNVNTIGVRSCYDEGKRMAETLFSDYKRIYNVDVRIVRIFNTYGPNMCKNDGRVVSNFIVQALNNENITIYGDGSQTRSFCYISDLVSGIMSCMNNDYCKPVNIGNPHEISMRDLAELIVKLCESHSKIVYLETSPDDPKRRKPDIELAKKLYGWSPKVDLVDGLISTIEYFKNTI